MRRIITAEKKLKQARQILKMVERGTFKVVGDPKYR